MIDEKFIDEQLKKSSLAFAEQCFEIIKDNYKKGYSDGYAIGYALGCAHNSSNEMMRCNTCMYDTNDELSGECYECIKGIQDHYTAIEFKEK